MISEGRSINVTLIFSITRYGEVIEAYLSGLEDYVASGATDLSTVASVASFFISRSTPRRTAASKRRRRAPRTATSSSPAGARRHLPGPAGYKLFTERFSGPRWEALADKGAKVQRPLWASTSTKNPDYPDLAYVDSLIGLTP